MRASLLVVPLLLLACAGRRPTPEPTGDAPPAAAPPNAAPAAAPAPDAAPAAPPDAAPAPAPASACRADAKHCCTPDGRLVVPGGCQPSYPGHVQPATNRGPDGRCVPIECHLKCLPGDALVRTPAGERAVATLAVGDPVFTAGCDGRPRLAAIERVSRTSVYSAATVVSLTLADGRRVRASAGHPLATGARLDTLGVGASLDGSRVVGRELVPLAGGATYDLLPTGPTGTYWADGVLLGSTLAQPSCGSD